MAMDPNNLARILDAALPFVFIGLVLVIFFILFFIPTLLLALGRRLKGMQALLEIINARQEKAIEFQLQHMNQSVGFDQKILSGIAGMVGQEKISQVVEEGLAPMPGRMEELFGLIKALSADMAARDKPHHDEIRTLVTRMEHAQYLDRKKLDALATELTARIEELAEKVEGLSARTIRTYMQEILNRLIEMQENVNPSQE